MLKKIQDTLDWWRIKLMMRIGMKLYPYIVTWRMPWETNKVNRVVMFAESERDFNTCVRDQVERLDAPTERTDESSK